MNDIEKRLYMLESVSDYLESGVHAVDENGRTLIYNRKMMEIESMEIQDVLDKNLLDVFQFQQEEESTLLNVLKHKVPTLNRKQTYFNNKGQKITTINNTYPIFYEEQFLGAVEIAKDITKLENILKGSYQKNASSLNMLESIVGASQVLLDALEIARKAAQTSSPILIIGETGTGKDLFAQGIHTASSQPEEPFIVQNCSALPQDTLESILFGSSSHDSFQRSSLFEQAEGGTLLLNELHALPLSTQSKLLTFLQEKKLPQSENQKEIDVRIIATMNEDPIDAISNGKLRKDLYYRLSIVTLFIPPLRERKEDLQKLVSYFIDHYNNMFGMSVKGVSKKVQNLFEAHDWPGNVRELQHVIEASYNVLELDYRDTIQYDHLPMQFRQRIQLGAEHTATLAEHFLFTGDTDIKPLDVFMEEAETYYIQKALKHHDYNITKTAKSLGMSRQNLQYRIRKYGIERPSM